MVVTPPTNRLKHLGGKTSYILFQYVLHHIPMRFVLKVDHLVKIWHLTTEKIHDLFQYRDASYPYAVCTNYTNDITLINRLIILLKDNILQKKNTFFVSARDASYSYAVCTLLRTCYRPRRAPKYRPLWSGMCSRESMKML